MAWPTFLAFSVGTDRALSADCLKSLRAADAVVYLAGGPLFDGRRHSRSDVEQETASRVRDIGHLVAPLGQADRRPDTLVAASSVGSPSWAGTSAGGSASVRAGLRGYTSPTKSRSSLPSCLGQQGTEVCPSEARAPT
jgi:hypothetical protein